MLQDQNGIFQSSARTLKGGIYSAVVPPGHYKAYATDGIRDVVEAGDVEVKAEGSANIDLELLQPAMLNVVVKDDSGRTLPAKISVEGVYEHSCDPRGVGIREGNPVSLGQHVAQNWLEGTRDLRNAETFTLRLTSSTTTPGHTASSSLSLVSRCPDCRTSVTRRSSLP